jgi:hypothetical protein
MQVRAQLCVNAARAQARVVDASACPTLRQCSAGVVDASVCPTLRQCSAGTRKGGEKLLLFPQASCLSAALWIQASPLLQAGPHLAGRVDKAPHLLLGLLTRDWIAVEVLRRRMTPAYP